MSGKISEENKFIKHGYGFYFNPLRDNITSDKSNILY